MVRMDIRQFVGFVLLRARVTIDILCILGRLKTCMENLTWSEQTEHVLSVEESIEADQEFSG